jgi:hypothetical protein
MARLGERTKMGPGVFRRSIALESSGGEVRGELADDFHHFAVRVVHDGERATRVEGEDVRVPWTTCPGAVEPLRRMVGAPVSDRVLEVFKHTRPREQCTHLHDLACLALTHAARGEGRRRYDVAVPERVGGATEAVLRFDGEDLLRWGLQGNRVQRSTPDVFDGLPLAISPFLDFLLDELRDRPALVEAAWILQRAVFIGGGRRHDFEGMREAKDFAAVVGAACHTFAPERVGDARRVGGTVRDFSDAPEKVLDREQESAPR